MQQEQLGIRFFGGDEESGNVFIVETKASAGYELGSHVHKHAHTSVLVSGKARVTVNGMHKYFEGYNVIVIPKDTEHCVKALTDIVWLCIWDSNLAPIEEAKESLKLQRISKE